MAHATKVLVEIRCPRCQGEGARPDVWSPEQGVCYRCKGRGVVKVNVDSLKAVIFRLRLTWKRVNQSFKRAQDPEDKEYLKTVLAEVTRRGLGVRAEIDEAEAVLRKKNSFPLKACQCKCGSCSPVQCIEGAPLSGTSGTVHNGTI